MKEQYIKQVEKAVAEEFGQQCVVAVFELLEGLQVAVDAVGFGVVFDYRELSVLDRTAQHLQRPPDGFMIC